MVKWLTYHYNGIIMVVREGFMRLNRKLFKEMVEKKFSSNVKFCMRCGMSLHDLKVVLYGAEEDEKRKDLIVMYVGRFARELLVQTETLFEE